MKNPILIIIWNAATAASGGDDEWAV